MEQILRNLTVQNWYCYISLIFKGAVLQNITIRISTDELKQFVHLNWFPQCNESTDRQWISL